MKDTGRFEAEPVAYVESSRTEPIDDDWSSVESSIVLGDDFDESALQGIEDFSHIEVTFFFHRVDPASIERGARRPRGNPDFPLTGIFAQRAKNRPNRIGHTTCRLVKREGRRLHVVDLDCIDGTPVLDIKPSVREFLPHPPYRQPRWTEELLANYWAAAPTLPAAKLIGVAVSERTSQHINALFEGEDRSHVAELLETHCGNSLPLWHDKTPEGLERIRFAVLKLSAGDLERFDVWLREAQLDWRDCLVAAGFAHNLRAHVEWSSGDVQE